MMNNKTYILPVLAAAMAMALPFKAEAQKKAMDHDVYDTWESVSSVGRTDDGNVLVWAENPQVGDGTLYVRKMTPAKKGRKADPEAYSQTEIPRGYNYMLDPKGNWLYGRIKPKYEVTRQEKIKKQKNDTAKDTLFILNLKTMEWKTYGRVDGANTPNLDKDKLAYKSTWKEFKDSTDKKGSEKSGVIVLDPATGKADTLRNVGGYTFNVQGDKFAFNTTKDKKDSLTCNSVVIMHFPSLRRDTLIRGAEKGYKNLTFSDAGDMLAFMGSCDTSKNRTKSYALYLASYAPADKHGNIPQPELRTIVPQGKVAEGTDGWTVSEHSRVYFSADATRLFTSVGPIVPPKDTSIIDFETASVNIWKWDDVLTPPQQRLQNKQITQRTYTVVIDLADTSKFRPLTTSPYEQVNIMDASMSDWAISRDNSKYVLSKVWDSNNFTDLSVFNIWDGTRKVIAEKLPMGHFGASPSGRYIVWFDSSDLHWYCYDTQTDTKVNLTAQTGVNFYIEDDDHPNAPSAYDGGIKWFDDESHLMFCDRYDLWRFTPDGSEAVNLTGGVGRQTHNRFRVVNPKPDKRLPNASRSGVPNNYTAKQDIYLSVYNEDDKTNGFGTMNLAKPAKTLKYFTDTVTFTTVMGTKLTDRIFFQKGNFRNCYDLYYTDDLFASDTKVTAVNPQKEQYRWGRAELFQWKAYDGTPLDGIVYIPDGIKEGEKLPVIVYFYEKNSQLLYGWSNPSPSRSVINYPFYTSRGYIVFVPDIVYQVGHPGESAYNCICSGAEALCEKYPFADKSKMAIQGQSWGGYQTAYLVTRTNMFAAAGAGAPVSNMTSAYGGIRWGSGIVRAGQYEHGQSRIGKSLWDEGGFELYVENSPVFFLDKVETPLLIMHNDNDGAVPWYQGIEMFSGLRRLGKPVWMLQYDKEAHNLGQRKNFYDLSKRMTQFFDHYLKGEPMPAWMKTGVPYAVKSEYFGFEYPQEAADSGLE